MLQNKNKRFYIIMIIGALITVIFLVNSSFHSSIILTYPIPIKKADNNWVFIMPDLTEKKSGFQNIEFIDNRFYLCKNENNKYGVLNLKLEQVTPFIFNKLSLLNNSLFIGLVNDKNYIVDASKMNLYFYSKYELNNSRYWRNGLIIFGSEGITGIIDCMGNIVLEPIYDQILFKYNYRFKNYIFDKAIILKNGKERYLNEHGKLISEIKYDLAMPFHNGKAAVSLWGKWGLIDTNINFIAKPIYDNVGVFCLNNIPKKKDRSFYIHRKYLGEDAFIFELDYKVSEPIYLSYNGKTEFIESSGSKIHGANFRPNKTAISWDNKMKYGYLVDSNEKRISKKYDYLYPISQGTLKYLPYFVVGNYHDKFKKKLGLIDDNGKYIFEEKYNEINLIDTNYAVLRDDIQTILFNCQKRRQTVVGSVNASIVRINYNPFAEFITINNNYKSNGFYKIIWGKNGLIFQDSLSREPVYYDKVVCIFRNGSNYLIDYAGNVIWSEK